MTDRPHLLVVDIDGTLINQAGVISDADRQALASARQAGVQVSLSTGRVTQACQKTLELLSLDGYHVFFDGALVSDTHGDKEVYVEPVAPELVKEMAEFAYQQEMRIELFSSMHLFVKQEDWGTEIRREFFGLEPTVTDLNQLWQRQRIIKGTLVIRSEEEKAQAHLFCRYFEGRLNFTWAKTPVYPDADFVNIISREVSKGRALEELVAFLGIPLSQVVAIGDGTNDISLLSTAGLAIAVGNAHEELKAVADHIVPDVEHNGVAAAVEKFVL
ncbi:MAG: HAD family phosphatase [Dehalococcoidales bacterium]|nr:MAG: HAD family phosphatase [Dehalococcoidales bacterium]